jgi:hypothetical protein
MRPRAGSCDHAVAGGHRAPGNAVGADARPRDHVVEALAAVEGFPAVFRGGGDVGEVGDDVGGDGGLWVPVGAGFPASHRM